MRICFRIQLIHLTLIFASSVHSANVTIQSNPPTNGGFVITKPERTVSLTCTVENSAQAEQLQWLRNGREVSLKAENRFNTSHVCVQPVNRDDNFVTFTCQLKSNANVKDSIQLEVQYPPTLGQNVDVNVEEKSDAVLSCDVRAYPPVTVVWKKDDILLDLSPSNYKTSNDGITASLSVSNVNRNQHRGVFSCEANSTVFGVNKKSFNVTVVDRTMKFPLWPTVAGVVVVILTMLLAAISRLDKIMKCFKKG
ncbi:transmembrane and immunoglobulin domain-containing protein 1 [Clarias gariepinus]|uniref:transmembrane and immunoglobulin domain-containing protein 1 n=1 Tax=Clarias gariepinus TaxID=13013 RepID=UPI00234E231B|nr:transmembrane and immunoglobulin domain-containing protein 1 [Clarias gariepinus]